MKNAMGIIFTDRDEYRLSQLTQKRAAAALPIASRYRLIDFTLSNMVNAGIINVGVPTQSNYSSLMDHLGTGSEWDLARKNYGLFILPPFVSQGSMTGARGDIDVLYGILPYIRRSSQKYVLLADGNLIYNMNYCDIQRFHRDTNADITLLYNHIDPAGEPSRYTMLTVEEDGRVTDVEERPGHTGRTSAYMNVMLLEKSLLEALIEGCVARGEHDLVMDVLVKNTNNLRIFGFPYRGYVGRVDSVESYFQINMDLLDPDIRRELFNPNNPVYTKVKDNVPAKHGEWADVKNSLIADGCIVDGRVENSILFRGVQVRRGAVIRNSIVMQDSYIHEDCELDCAVIDKNVHIREDVRLVGQPSYPVIIPKGATV